MESLKKFEEICQPDARQAAFGIFEPRAGFIPSRLEDLYQVAESIQLHDGVPEDVHNLFQTARNLLVYAWFYYPFNVTARLSAFAAAERALRIKAGVDAVERAPTFRPLMEMAVARKWLRDEDFTFARQRHESVKAWNEERPPDSQVALSPLEQEYCTVLTETMPFLQNTLAHGKSFLDNGGATSVRLCAELINQLFEKPATP